MHVYNVKPHLLIDKVIYDVCIVLCKRRTFRKFNSLLWTDDNCRFALLSSSAAAAASTCTSNDDGSNAATTESSSRFTSSCAGCAFPNDKQQHSTPNTNINDVSMAAGELHGKSIWTNVTKNTLYSYTYRYW